MTFTRHSSLHNPQPRDPIEARSSCTTLKMSRPCKQSEQEPLKDINYDELFDRFCKAYKSTGIVIRNLEPNVRELREDVQLVVNGEDPKYNDCFREFGRENEMEMLGIVLALAESSYKEAMDDMNRYKQGLREMMRDA